MASNFTKLSNLIGDRITIEKVGQPSWKLWNAATNKMDLSLSPQKGYRKLYPVETDKGLLDMGVGQIGNMLEAVMFNGNANIVGKTYEVRSNGKTGMEVRYFLNPVKPTVDEVYEPENFDPSEIPF